jgi:type II secretory pathway pseudopilin PulG
MMARSQARSRGMALISVLVVLMILGGFSLTLVRTLAAKRRILRNEEQRIQAEWLAEAGIERASARLKENGDARAETWNIPPEELGGRGGGKVTIAFDPPTPDSSRRHVRIEAEFPVDEDAQAVVHREFDVNPDGTNPGESQ